MQTMTQLAYYTCLAASILLGVVGQITLKTAANSSATISAQFLDPLTLVGLAFYFVAGLFYIVALSVRILIGIVVLGAH